LFFQYAQALKSKLTEGKEVTHGLPPFAPRKAFKVDEYQCPENWMHGSSLASSYFVPIEAEHGLWLDFNRNWSHKHQVAILISVQGINPLDGQSMVEGSLNLRQYKTKCPVHDVDFGADRFCEKCGYKWVPQNYLSTTGTPHGLLWLDGFLAEDGVVRQYYFTEEEIKGVAHQIIGADKKVYSIGIAFYLSKEPKPVPVTPTAYRSSDWGCAGSFGSPLLKSNAVDNYYAGSNSNFGFSAPSSKKALRTRGGGSSVGRPQNVRLRTSYGNQIQLNDQGPSIEQIPVSTDVDYASDEVAESAARLLDIAAGAKIDQKVYADPNDLDFWQEKPAGLLYINYCPTEQATAILKKGKKDLTKDGEGFMAGLKAGR
jgi:hypothetical protein